MAYEVVIPLSHPLRGAAVADPGAPLAAAPPPESTLSQADLQARWLAEERQRAQAEGQRVEQVLAGLTQAVEALRAEYRRHLAELEQDAVELAVAVARRLLLDRLDDGRFPVEALVGAALKRLASDGPVVVRLHPDDLALLERRTGGRPLVPSDHEVRLVADPEVARGGCRAEAGEVLVAFDLEAQLGALRGLLLEGIADAAEGAEPGA